MEADVRICKLKSYWTFWVFQNSKVMPLSYFWKVCWHLVREVKEADSKSAGLCPRRFESCRCRCFTGAVQWPSGLRRSTQVRVSSEAWVRTPPEPFFVVHGSHAHVSYAGRVDWETKVFVLCLNGYNRNTPRYCNTGVTSGFGHRSELDAQRLRYRNNVNHLEDTWSSYQRLSW